MQKHEKYILVVTKNYLEIFHSRESVQTKITNFKTITENKAEICRFIPDKCKYLGIRLKEKDKRENNFQEMYYFTQELWKFSSQWRKIASNICIYEPVK